MPETFELFRFIDHLRRRWNVIALACGVAVALALVAGLVVPNEYTATTRIVIEPPAGTDLRAAMAVSPIYFESLKTYELVASGDRLFLDSIEHFKLPHRMAIDRLKRSVLKVSIPRNTKILEISVTLRDPKPAQALALYIAEQTVRLTRETATETEQDLILDAQKQREEARARMEKAEAALTALSRNSSDASADRAAQLNTAQIQSDTARAAFETADEHLAEVRSTAGFRGERLRIIDPGVIPERPSWPNVPLNLLIAIFVALAASLTYLAFEFNYRLARSAAPRALSPVARVKSGHD